MMTPMISSLSGLAEPSPLPQLPLSAQPATPSGGFANWMVAQLDEVQQLEKSAEQGLLGVASGQADSLHQVMIDLEQAKLSFQLLLQVRNRALEAYQEVMRMQI